MTVLWRTIVLLTVAANAHHATVAACRYVLARRAYRNVSAASILACLGVE